MEAGFAIQIFSTLFQTFGAILGIASAFYIYLLQTYKGRFLGWHGEDKNIRFESPSSSFWDYFVLTVALMISCSLFMYTTAVRLHPENTDLAVGGVLGVSAVDLIFFGFTMKNFSAYPDKLRRFLNKYDVYEAPAGYRIISPKEKS